MSGGLRRRTYSALETDDMGLLIQEGAKKTMILLNVTYKCKSGKGEDFLGTIKAEGIDVACRAEEGNRRTLRDWVS